MRNNIRLNNWVKFRVGKRTHFGKLLSVERDVANIRGFEQASKERPAYHYPVDEITEANHTEVFKLGRAAINLFR